MPLKIKIEAKPNHWQMEVSNGSLIAVGGGNGCGTSNECLYTAVISAFEYVNRNEGSYHVFGVPRWIKEQLRGRFEAHADNIILLRNKAQDIFQEVKDRIQFRG